MPMQQGSRFYIPLESTCLFDTHCYEFCDRESYDGFVIPAERELIAKNLLFDLLIMVRSFRNLFYLLSCSLSQRRFRRIYSRYYEALNQTLLAQKYWEYSQYILRIVGLWHPLSSSMLNSRFVH